MQKRNRQYSVERECVRRWQMNRWSRTGEATDCFRLRYQVEWVLSL